MSSDPEAIIYYGFPLEDLDDETSLLDINDEWRHLKQPPSPTDRSDYHTPEWEQWRERRKQWDDSFENVELDFSGTENCQTKYIHAHALQITVSWDEQLPLSKYNFQPQPEADLHIKKFCEHFNLPYTQPEWHLAARYF